MKKFRLELLKFLELQSNIDILTMNDSKNYHQKWKNTFFNLIEKNLITKYNCDKTYWHIFSFNLISHFKNEEAINSFLKANIEQAIIFFSNTNNDGFILDIKAKSFWNSFMDFINNRNIPTDIYIVDNSFTTTLTITHEKEFGPYFTNIKPIHKY